MKSTLIETQAAFDELCAHIRQMGVVAFDTEFVSEFTYRPELCLLQFATTEQAAAVDPFAVSDLSAWWELMVDPNITVIIHGGREEIRFCLTCAGKSPTNFWDVQVAEGLLSRSFPLGYEALVKRVLGKTAHGRETRSDWRKRPLQDSQIAYAIDDVKHLPEIWRRQRAAMTKQGRVDWALSEFERMLREIIAETAPESWLRLSGLNRLNPQELAIAREVYHWRLNEAIERNRPLRKLLRDDLIIEIARRKPRTLDDLLGTRDFNRTDYKRYAPELLEAIERGLAAPPINVADLPRSLDDDKSHDEQVLGQLLGLALANRCAELNVSMGLVGKTADLRHLVRWHVFSEQDGPPPRLTQGWRAVVCGDLLTDVLDGKIAIRVADPHSDHPLVFNRLDEGARPE